MDYTTLSNTWIFEPLYDPHTGTFGKWQKGLCRFGKASDDILEPYSYNPYTGTFRQWQKRLSGKGRFGEATNAILESGGIKSPGNEDVPILGDAAIIPGHVRQNPFTAGYPYSYYR
jgi:hypothetical protein